jgi:hypothetical protein
VNSHHVIFLGRDRPKPRSLLYSTEVLVARTGTFSHLIDHIRPQLQSISSREPGAPDGILVVLIRLTAHRADAWKSRQARRSQGFVVNPDIPRSGESQSCRHYQSLTLVSDTTTRAWPWARLQRPRQSHTVGRCWQSCGVPVRQTTLLDVLCLMSAGAGPVARGADANLSEGLGRQGAWPRYQNTSAVEETGDARHLAAGRGDRGGVAGKPAMAD